MAGSANSFAGDGDVTHFLGGGDYWIVDVDINNAVNVSNAFAVNDREIKLSPNPVKGNFTLILPASFTKKKIIIISSTSGDEIYRLEDNTRTQINISLPGKTMNGIYTLTILYEEKVLKQQLVIQK